MKILVITPTLGTSPWLAETVASVAALPVAVRHVLVAPAPIVAALQQKFPGSTVVPEPGGGMYAAINAGLAAGGEWDAFTYLNDDDLLLPHFAASARALPAGRSAFAYGGVRLIDGSGHALGAIPVSHFPSDNRALYAQRLEPVYQHGTAITRAAWEQHGGFDAAFRFCGDSEFLARLCVAGVPATYIGGTVAAFRLHPGQLTKDRAAMSAERARVDAKLGLLEAPASPGRWRARFGFRAANLPVYLGRLARHGWISFDQLLERGGRPPQA